MNACCRLFYHCLSGLICCAAVLAAQASEVKDGQRLEEQPSRIPDEITLPDQVRIGFSLERHLSLFPDPLLSTGELVIDRQKKAVRWHFDKEVTLILVNNQLRRFGPNGAEEDINLQRDAAAKALKQQMIGFRDGDWSAFEKLVDLKETKQDIILDSPNGVDKERLIHSTKMVFTPKDGHLKELLYTIILIVRQDNGSPHLLELLSSNGDKTIYRFNEPILNEDFDDAFFKIP